MRTYGWIFMAFAMVCLESRGADWPQYLGPTRDAVSTETGLLRGWPEDGPQVLWTVPLGEGFGGPAVSDGMVYVLDRDGSKRDVLRCFRLEDGGPVWSFAYEAPGETSFPGSRSVPAVDRDHVFTCGPFGDVYCFDRNKHRPVWTKSVWKDFGGAERVPTWAISQNPLVSGDLLILASQTKQAGVVAYEKRTGDVAWTSPALPAESATCLPPSSLLAAGTMW